MPAIYSLPCPQCQEFIELEVTEDQYRVLTSPHQPPIQQILPHLDAGIRERFISGVCPRCWDTLFNYDEEY